MPDQWDNADPTPLAGAVSGGDSSIDIRFQLRLSRADVVVSNLLRLCVARSIDAL